MTGVDDTAALLRAFRDKLPPHLQRWTRTGRITVAVSTATREHGWTLEQLAAECTRDTLGVVDNPGGLLTHRLEQCAEGPPTKGRPPGVGRKIAFCSPECSDNAGWILDPKTGLPAERCPCRTPAEVTP